MIIRLQDIELWAYHGVLEQERRSGNLFRVGVQLDVPDTQGVFTDSIEDTLDYSRVYDVVAREMSTPSNLLEHVAGRLVAALQAAFPQATRVSVEVSKRQPPVGGNVAWASVRIDKQKKE